MQSPWARRLRAFGGKPYTPDSVNQPVLEMSSLPLTAGTTLLIVLLMFATTFLVGKARHRYQIKAPAVSGHPLFERAYRIQMNTLEWAAMTLPCLWIFAIYVSDLYAMLLGLLWLLGRILYAIGYHRDPPLRARGFVIAAAAFGALGLGGGAGVIVAILGGAA